MENNTYQIVENRIEDRVLHMDIRIRADGGDGRNARFALVFRDGGQDRRFPLNVSWKEKEAYGAAEAAIELPWVFSGEAKGDPVTVSIEKFTGDGWTALQGGAIACPAEQFGAPGSRAGRIGAGNVALFCLCIPLLPLFFLHGLMAYCGVVPLDTGENTAKGKKAILIHANELTRKISGLSYSRREWHTRWFRRCYRRAAAKPVRDGQILFLSERKAEPGGNLERIRRALADRAATAPVEYYLEKEYTRATIDRLSLREIRKTANVIAASPYILLEDFYPQLHQIALRKETRAIQLWHACGAFKTFGFSRLGKPGGALQSSPNHRSYWRAVVSGTEMIPFYAEAFGIPTSRVLALGVPRTDVFFQKEAMDRTRSRLYQTYPWLSGKRVVLFAPTFRGDGNKDAYYPMDRFHPDLWMEQLPDDCAVLVKFHPFVKERGSFEEKWEGRIADLSERESVNDLLMIADVLVTDYSSVIFEAALLDVPMVFYGFDWNDYVRDRDIYGYYPDFVPGPLAQTEEQLLQCLRTIPDRVDLERFRRTYMDALDGRCTERIADFILDCVRGDVR